MTPSSSPPQSPSFIRHIAYLQVIGIILVVFGHSFHEYPAADASGGSQLLVYRMMYSFRMPVFMFVSGYLMLYTSFLRHTHPSSGFGFIITKLRRLMLPFLFLTIVTFIPRSLFSTMADDHIALDPQSFLRSLFYPEHMVIPYFWFLQASFTLLVFCHTFILLGRRVRISHGLLLAMLLLLAVLLLVLPFSPTSFFSFHHVCRLAVYFVIGMIYCRYSAAIDTLLRPASPITLLISAALWATLFLTAQTIPAIMPLCSVAGISMCLSLARIMDVRGITILQPLIGANYIIFLLSWYFNVASQQILHHHIDMPWWIFTILSFTTGILIPWLIYRLLLRTRTAPLTRITAHLLGQSLRSPNSYKKT